MRIELRGAVDARSRCASSRRASACAKACAQVCADLMPRVGGNPFFLLEMVDALLERGALEIRESQAEAGEPTTSLARTERADGTGGGPKRSRRRSSSCSATASRELPATEHAVVDWLAIAGGPLASTDLLKLAAATDDEAVVRLCARGLCDRKGETVDFRHPLTRDVAYVALDADDRTRMHRALGEHLAQTSLARGLSAAIVARHLARGEAPTARRDFYFEAASAARASYQTPLAIRYFQRAAARTCALGRHAARLAAHEALEAIYRILGRRRERVWHLEALRRIAADIGTPRAVCLGLLRTARYDFDEGHLAHGLPLAQARGGGRARARASSTAARSRPRRS